MREALDRESAVPLYVQLAEILRAKVASGEWKPGQKVTSENELDRLYGVSRMTARQVIAQLVSEGLLFRVQGKGTFVQPTKIAAPAPSGYRGIREQLEDRGYQTTTEVLEVGSTIADADVAAALDLVQGDPVMQVRRVRTVDGQPISYHCSFIPARLAADLPTHDMGSRQLCVLLAQEYGLDMGRVFETLEVIAASDEQADALSVPKDAPILLLQQRVQTPNGQPFELSRIAFRGDRIRLQFEYAI